MTSAASSPPASRTAALAGILAELNLTPATRVLDMLPRAQGAETTALLVANPGWSVDVVPASAADRSALHAAFGERIGFEPEGLYDLVVVSPVLGEIVDMIEELGWLAARRVKPGGRLVTLGLRPDALDTTGVDQLDDLCITRFRRDFGVRRGRATRAPAAWGAELKLERIIPRQPRSSSPVAWMVMRRRTAASSAWRRGLSRFSGRSGGFEAFAARFLQAAPLFAAEDCRDLLQDLVDPASVDALVRTTDAIDTVMFVDNEFIDDPRVVRTARSVGATGRGLLAVGLSPDQRGGRSELASGIPLLLLPNYRARLGRRLRLMGDTGQRHRWWELKMAAAALLLAWLIQNVRARPLVLHTHDFMGLFAGGAALDGLAPPVRSGVVWVHDVHEYVQGYGLIDPEVQQTAADWEERWLPQLDAMTTVSPELAAALARHYPQAPEAAVILSALARDAAADEPVENLRELYATADAPIIVHAGSLRPGRGVEHVVSALERLPRHHLVLIGDDANDYGQMLRDRARLGGVGERVHFHGYQPPGRLVGLCAQCDVGVIPMDSYGNAEVSLPNKVFIYMEAGLPVVSTATGSLTRMITESGIGTIVPCGDAEALATAIAGVAPPTRGAIEAYSWEYQERVLHGVYAGLIRKATSRLRGGGATPSDAV